VPKIPTSLKPWIRNASDELAVRAGCTFDEAAGQRVCDFLESYCYLSEGRWAGKPMELIDWQRDSSMRMYGWKRPNGTRRFRWVYCEVGKKNGKSPWTSGLACYHLVADDEGGPKIYLNACDRSQARIVFEHAANMVRQSPDLSESVEVIDSADRLVCRENFGAVLANSNVVDSKDGKNASLVINDEIHRWVGRKLWNVFKYAGASRTQPLNISITTAGEAESGVWYEQRVYSEQVNDGTIPDWTHLGIVYRALPTDDIDDPSTWAKANPSLGVTIDPDEFRADLVKAKRIPVDLAEFKRLRLNIVVASAAKFLPPEAWKRCSEAPAPISRRPCWVGLDLASVNDLAAMAAICGSEAEGYDVHVWFWLPEDNILALEHEHGQPYRVWAEHGFITLTPGAAIDYEFIIAQVVKLDGQVDLKQIFLDPHNANQVYTSLKEKHGLPVEMFRQGAMYVNCPTKQLLRLVLMTKIRHGGHPVLSWNAANAVASKNAHENIQLHKEKSTGKIDGLAALVNALAAQAAPGQPKPSVYETRGVRTT
jgi:phage terminase large subunit-like protein